MSEKIIPTSIGFILDGNRRWAAEQGLPSLEGHRQGGEKVKEIVVWAHDAGIKEIIVYAFSTENWNRSAEEVSYLLKLFETTVDALAEQVVQAKGVIRFIGQRERFPQALQDKMNTAETKTAGGTEGTLAIALSYGGRAEILSAVNSVLAKGFETVDEEQLRDAMWSRGLRDPDLIVRTGGEKRLSNFLTWQSVYSELFFTDTKLPAFTKEEFDSILEEYASRERRHGV